MSTEPIAPSSSPKRHLTGVSEGELAIWYVSNFQRCNFTCSYCVSGQPSLQQSADAPSWLTSAEMHESIVDWLIAQPHTIRLRINSIGEPFVSTPYLDSVARLTRAPNVSFVEILTNGSFRLAQFDQFAERAEPSKLSLWMTFHHQFISPAALVEAALHAKGKGAFVVVNALLFPDNVEAVSELIALCEANDVRFATGAGINSNDAYPSMGFVPIYEQVVARAIELVQRKNSLGDFHNLSAEPLGKPCSAGSDYFFINWSGDVFPCKNYVHAAPKTKLGSVFDPDFRLAPRTARYAPCQSKSRCLCVEDYQNLEAIQQEFTWPHPSFGVPSQTST